MIRPSVRRKCGLPPAAKPASAPVQPSKGKVHRCRWQSVSSHRARCTLGPRCLWQSRHAVAPLLYTTTRLCGPISMGAAGPATASPPMTPMGPAPPACTVGATSAAAAAAASSAPCCCRRFRLTPASGDNRDQSSLFCLARCFHPGGPSPPPAAASAAMHAAKHATSHACTRPACLCAVAAGSPSQVARGTHPHSQKQRGCPFQARCKAARSST